MSESLAVRWRPRRFSDVAGQEHVTAVLRAAAGRTAPPQQILLAGPSGLGKTTTARIFAAAVLCPHRSAEGDPCGLCDTCLEITGSGNGHPDVIELDAASNGGKDEIRDLAARAILAPLRGAWKIYIVDEAHGLTGPGGQAFLRLLEEPPGHCLFILATTDPGKLPVAVRGRCVNLEVLPPTREQALRNLQRIATGEDWDLPGDVADAVLAATDPALGMRGTVMTLDKLAGPLSAGADLTIAEVEQLLGVSPNGLLEELTSAVVRGDARAAVGVFQDLTTRPGRVNLRRQLTRWAHDRLVESAASGEKFDQAFYRYSTLVEAGPSEADLLLATIRAAHGPVPPPTRAPEPPATETVDPAPVREPQATTENHVAPAHAAPNETHVQDSPGEVNPRTRETLTSGDPRVVALLNAVGKVSGPAAFVLRRCEFHDEDGTIVVSVPPGQRAKAGAANLAAVVAQASSGDHQARMEG